MISASHNPWEDNGVKVFSSRGTKLEDALEAQVEAEVRATLEQPDTSRESSGGASMSPADEPSLPARYADWLVERGVAAGSLGGLSLVVDCANGAASELAPSVLSRLGATLTVIHASPDGRNINEKCGSLHLESLAGAVADARADAGVAFDGDADRALFVTRDGRTVDGDEVLLIAADALLRGGRLRGGAIVGTVMSNLGLEQALAQRGLGLVREAVGDRNVLARMQRDQCSLGGEPSGHVIFMDEAPTGDGLMTAIQLLAAVQASGQTLGALAAKMPRTPQILRNVRVQRRAPLESLPGWSELLDHWTARLGRDGRVLVRYSGTEPLVRVMAEGSNEPLVTECADALANHIDGALGA
jgi:phosphoglucosamine mutase